MPNPDDYINELRQAVSWAGLNYEAWWVYKSEETRPRFVETMNRYDVYFRTSIHAHFVALLAALYRIYETRSDTYNVPRLLKLLRKNKTLEEEKLQELEGLCNEARSLWRKVNVLRSEAFVHRSTTLDISSVFKKAGIRPLDLKILIEKTERLINSISREVNNSSHEFNYGARDDLIQLLEDLGNSRTSA